MASKVSAPKLPRLEMVKVPDWNSSGASCLAPCALHQVRPVAANLRDTTPHLLQC